MSDPCEIVESYAAGVSVALPGRRTILADAASASDASYPGRTVTVADIGTLSDQAFPQSYFVQLDTGHLTDAVIVGVTRKVIVTDMARGFDSLFGFGEKSQADTGQLSDAVFITRSATLNDIGGRLTDAAFPHVSRSQTVSSIAKGFDAAIPGQFQMVVDIGTAFDGAITGKTPIREIVTDIGQITDVAIDAFTPRNIVADVARGTDSLSTTLAVRGMLIDIAVGFDEVILPFDGAAWSASTDTFAMSRYEAFKFNSIAEIDGRLFALGAGGAYSLDGEDESVASKIISGLLDFGDPRLKRAPYCYVGYTSKSPLKISVRNTENGKLVSYDYELPVRIAVDPVPGRFRMGRGMKSRYLGFTITNTKGADFSVFDCKLPLEDTSRKV